MSKIWMPGGGGSGASSDDCTLVKANVPRGMTAVTADSNDEAVEGTLNTETTLSDSQALAGQTYLKWNPQTKRFEKREGEMANIGSVSQSLPINGSYTIPAGYHNGSGSVYQNVPTKGAQSYTPGTWNQTIGEGQWLAGPQTIIGDANLRSENIKKGITIFGVTGTFEGIASAPYYLWRRGRYENGKSFSFSPGDGPSDSFLRVKNYAYCTTYVDLTGIRFLKAVVSGDSPRVVYVNMSLLNSEGARVARGTSTATSTNEVTMFVNVENLNGLYQVRLDGGSENSTGTGITTTARYYEVFLSNE